MNSVNENRELVSGPKDIQGRGSIDAMIVYQALLDIKEAQGDTKAELRSINVRLDRLELLGNALSDKSTRIDERLSGIDQRLNSSDKKSDDIKTHLQGVIDTIKTYRNWGAAIAATCVALFAIFKFIEPHLTIAIK